MAWSYAYLALGALVGLAAMLAKRGQPIPALTFALTMLVVVLFWPFCILGGMMLMRRQMARLGECAFGIAVLILLYFQFFAG
jgi:hypothetical protein